MTMKKISQYMSPNLVAILNVSNRNEAISKLVDLAYDQKKVQNKQGFFDAIIDREKIVSTGIGLSVAIPHAKLPGYDNFFIVVGILPQGVDWGTVDDSPVRLIFMIGGPDDKQTEYLQILSGITVAVKDEERRKKMLTTTSPAAIIDLLADF